MFVCTRNDALDDVLADFPKAHAVRNVVLAGHAFNQIKVIQELRQKEHKLSASNRSIIDRER